MKNNPDDIITTLAETAVERILHALNKDSVLAIFISGSVARGRIACFDNGDRLEIYSDLDISVVISNRRHWEECRRLARAAAASVPMESGRFKMFRPLDVGVYTTTDLSRQPARPGTVDIAAAHRLLYGDPALPALLSNLAEAPIDPGEGLYLLENRLLEMADLIEALPSQLSAGDERHLIYTALKAGQDAGAALLIFTNQFSPDPSMWPDRLREAAGEAGTSLLVPERGLEAIERAISAQQDLQSFLESGDRSHRAEWDRVKHLMLAVWFNIAARLYPGQSSDWAGLVSARCRRGQPLSNLREFRLLARRRGIAALPAILKGFLCHQLSPLAAMRLSGLVQSVSGRVEAEGDDAGRIEADLKKIFDPFLDRLTRFLNQPGGDLFNRTRALYRELN